MKFHSAAAAALAFGFMAAPVPAQAQQRAASLPPEMNVVPQSRPMRIEAGETLIAHFAACAPEHSIQTMGSVAITPRTDGFVDDILKPLVITVGAAEAELPHLNAAYAKVLNTEGKISDTQYVLMNGHFVRSVRNALMAHLNDPENRLQRAVDISIAPTVITGVCGMADNSIQQDRFFNKALQDLQAQLNTRGRFTNPVLQYVVDYRQMHLRATGTVYGILSQ